MIHRVIFAEIHRMTSAVTLRGNQSEASNLGTITNQIRAFSENYYRPATKLLRIQNLKFKNKQNKKYKLKKLKKV